jgi:hypothetical protein
MHYEHVLIKSGKEPFLESYLPKLILAKKKATTTNTICKETKDYLGILKSVSNNMRLLLR